MMDFTRPKRVANITEDAARGGLSPKEASAGAALTPMLVWGTALAIAGMMVVALVMYLRA